MSFFQLSLIAAVALLGPLLALSQKWHLPVVLGQLLAGIAIGRTGLGLVDSSNPTFTFVASHMTARRDVAALAEEGERSR